MRKWKQGVIALVIFFVAFPFVTVTGNEAVSILAVSLLFLSAIYAVLLVVAFTIQQTHGWMKKRYSKLEIEEKVVKTKLRTIYECGHCRAHYSDSQTCPQCGSPYRKTIEEKTEEETVEKWKR